MELHFTGRGAMLYPKEGNTSAYFEEENAFFLIDCGEDVASKLIAMHKLTKEKEYYVFITHTHSDHFGSIGTLQQYLYWCCGKKLNIVCADEMEYIKEIEDGLRVFGLVPGTYHLLPVQELDHRFSSFQQIRFIKSNHGDVPLSSCSLVLSTLQGNILYTGDIADSQVIQSFIECNPSSIDKMYIDTSYTPSPVHLSIEELNRIVPEHLRDKVYCMHINSKEILPLLQEYGFHLVSLENGDILSRDIDTMTPEEISLLEEELQQRLQQVQEYKEEHCLKKTLVANESPVVSCNCSGGDL